MTVETDLIAKLSALEEARLKAITFSGARTDAGAALDDAGEDIDLPETDDELADFQAEIDDAIERTENELAAEQDNRPLGGNSPALLQVATAALRAGELLTDGLEVDANCERAKPTDGGFLLTPAVADVSQLRVIESYGPIECHHLDADGGGATGEKLRIDVNMRAGGYPDALYLTVPGGIQDEDILVRSKGFGRAYGGGVFFDHAKRVLRLADIENTDPAQITFAKPHGGTVGKKLLLSLRQKTGSANAFTGFHSATVINTTKVSVPIDASAMIPSDLDTLAAGMLGALVLQSNPTVGGGIYTLDEPIEYVVPVEQAHGSRCLWNRFHVLHSYNGKITSAMYEHATQACEFLPDGKPEGLLDDHDIYSYDHGGGPLHPAVWTGLIIITRITFCPVMPGASRGFPNLIKTETEIRFPVGFKHLIGYGGSTWWPGRNNPTQDLHNLHFRAWTVGQRVFQSKDLWRGGNGSKIALTSRPFATDAGNKGTWDDDAPFGCFFSGRQSGVVQFKDIGDGYQGYQASDAELEAVLPNSLTEGLMALVAKRTVSPTFAFAACIHMEVPGGGHPPDRHSGYGYGYFQPGTTVGPEGLCGEQISAGGNLRQPGAGWRSRYRPGESIKNYSYLLFSATGAQLTDVWAGSESKGKLGILKDLVGVTAF